MAIYPFNTTPRMKFVAVMTFPVLMKIVRFIDLVIYFRVFTKKFQVEGLYAGVVPYQEIEWFLSVADNL